MGDKLDLFITCPFCCGAWISLAIYGLWLWLLGDYDVPSDLLLAAGVWMALSGAVALITTNLDPENQD
jgi:hypothetical protein